MLGIPPDLLYSYDAALAQDEIPEFQRAHYRRWLRFYLDFCAKYERAAGSGRVSGRSCESCGRRGRPTGCASRRSTRCGCTFSWARRVRSTQPARATLRAFRRRVGRADQWPGQPPSLRPSNPRSQLPGQPSGRPWSRRPGLRRHLRRGAPPLGPSMAAEPLRRVPVVRTVSRRAASGNQAFPRFLVPRREAPASRRQPGSSASRDPPPASATRGLRSAPLLHGRTRLATKACAAYPEAELPRSGREAGASRPGSHQVTSATGRRASAPAPTLERWSHQSGLEAEPAKSQPLKHGSQAVHAQPRCSRPCQTRMMTTVSPSRR
jgi:hypothetical protein